MTYFWKKQHLWKRNVGAGTTQNIGILRTPATRHMSLETTLLGTNADLSEVSCQFRSFTILTGAYSILSEAPDCVSGVDGKMYDFDSSFGLSTSISTLDVNFDVIGQTNDDSDWALRVSGWEIPITERLTPGSAATNLKVRRDLKSTTPTTWTTMFGVPLVQEHVVAIRAYVHAFQDLEGGTLLAGARKWFILAKNIAGTVTIIGDTADGTNFFSDGAQNVLDDIGMSLRAYPGSDLVNLQCNGNGDTEYSCFMESALIL